MFLSLHNNQRIENHSFQRTLFIPDALITSLARDPLAIGVYVAIARLVVAAKGAVPLAARDLAAWMGSNREADRVAIMCRIVKLTIDGWLWIERTVAAKHCLLPIWGYDHQGSTRPWSVPVYMLEAARLEDAENCVYCTIQTRGV